MTVAKGAGRTVDLSLKDFDGLYRAVTTWSRWGASDERGALHHITPEGIAAAAHLVRDGVTIGLGLPLNTRAEAHNPTPADHRMTLLPDSDIGLGSLRFVKDYVGVDYHNDTFSHIDALCHVAFAGSLYNGRSTDEVTASGATVHSIAALKDGLVGRGVLIDVPRLRGVDWLEPGDHVFPDDLEGAEVAQGVAVGEGDILLVRTGHAKRIASLGPWDTANAKAGLHPTAMPFVAERRVAAVGSDGNNDAAPGRTEGVAFPIHVLAIHAMGVHLLDYLDLEGLGVACEDAGRWEFLFVAAPLLIEGGTGSPLNPIAIL